MTEYAIFTENNDWEGEEWSVYFTFGESERDGLEAFSKHLEKMFENDFDQQYELTFETLDYDEDELEEVLADFASEGYFPERMVGKPNEKPEVLMTLDNTDLFNRLYKLAWFE